MQIEKRFAKFTKLAINLVSYTLAANTCSIHMAVKIVLVPLNNLWLLMHIVHVRIKAMYVATSKTSKACYIHRLSMELVFYNQQRLQVT